MSAAFESAGPGRFRVSGDLAFDTVPGLWAASRAALDAAPEILIDFDGVARVDSAGLALVVEWLRTAAGDRRQLRFANVPDKLLALARISELEPLLRGASLPR